jgi:DNA-binding transcriptional LysR family regulator
LVAFALDGAGIAVVFEVMSREHIASGKLVNVLEEWRISAEIELSILYTPRATMESKVRVFVEFMLEKMRNMR